ATGKTGEACSEGTNCGGAGKLGRAAICARFRREPWRSADRGKARQSAGFFQGNRGHGAHVESRLGTERRRRHGDGLELGAWVSEEAVERQSGVEESGAAGGGIEPAAEIGGRVAGVERRAARGDDRARRGVWRDVVRRNQGSGGAERYGRERLGIPVARGPSGRHGTGSLVWTEGAAELAAASAAVAAGEQQHRGETQRAVAANLGGRRAKRGQRDNRKGEIGEGECKASVSRPAFGSERGRGAVGRRHGARRDDGGVFGIAKI